VVGPPTYGQAVFLLTTAAANWTYIDGTAALRGGDPYELAPHRLCNLVELWVRENATGEEWAQFKAHMDRFGLGAPQARQGRSGAPRNEGDVLAYGAAVKEVTR
jgi:hypothetical protein